MCSTCYSSCSTEWYLMFVDQIFLAVYIMELVLKLYVWRLRFFKQMWNIFGTTTVENEMHVVYNMLTVKHLIVDPLR